jgi:hypothetical protein
MRNRLIPSRTYQSSVNHAEDSTIALDGHNWLVRGKIELSPGNFLYALLLTFL